MAAESMRMAGWRRKLFGTESESWLLMLWLFRRRLYFSVIYLFSSRYISRSSVCSLVWNLTCWSSSLPDDDYEIWLIQRREWEKWEKFWKACVQRNGLEGFEKKARSWHLFSYEEEKIEEKIWSEGEGARRTEENRERSLWGEKIKKKNEESWRSKRKLADENSKWRRAKACQK